MAYLIIWITRILTDFVACMMAIGRSLHKGAQQTNVQLVLCGLEHDSGARQPDVREEDNRGRLLSRTHMLYHSVIEHLPAIIYMIALEAGEQLLYISPRVEMALGFAHGEWIEGAEHWLHYLVSNSRARALSHALQTHEFAASEPIEFRILTR